MRDAITLALVALPGARGIFQGGRSLRQLTEPGPDPDSAARLVQELLEQLPTNGEGIPPAPALLRGAR